MQAFSGHGHSKSAQSGSAFLGLLGIYLGYAYWAERTQPIGASALHEKAESLEVTDTHLHDEEPLWRSILILVSGIVLIVAGGRWLVEGAVDLARLIGMSEAVIGLTVIAIGTSLPELVTSAIAAARRECDLCVGNVIGSNIFNITAIIGAAALFAPLPVPGEMLTRDLWVMIGASASLVPFVLFCRPLGRLAGAAFLALYLVYIWYAFF